jgi:hypothetical protein
MGAINYPRHFAYLAVAAVALIFMLVEPLPFTQSPDNRFTFFFALFGTLHALALVTALRAGPLWRRGIFVAITAALSGCIPFAGIELSRVLGLESLVAAMGLASAVGASAYWLLVRTFWFPSVNFPGGLFAVSLCVGATLSGLLLATVLSGFGANNLPAGDVIPTVLWWGAFSYSLWESEKPTVAANNRSRGP